MLVCDKNVYSQGVSVHTCFYVCNFRFKNVRHKSSGTQQFSCIKLTKLLCI
jgi:hypothetical protein